MNRTKLLDEFVGELTTLKICNDVVDGLDPAPVVNLCLQTSNDAAKVLPIQNQVVSEINIEDEFNNLLSCSFRRIDSNVHLLPPMSIISFTLPFVKKSGKLKPDDVFSRNTLIGISFHHIKVFEVIRSLIRDDVVVDVVYSYGILN